MATTIAGNAESHRTKGLNILSLGGGTFLGNNALLLMPLEDAGGPRGISQLQILEYVMEKVSRDYNNHSGVAVRRPCEVFDAIGGVGTGGLIAIFLVALRMTAKEAVDEFTNVATEVFKDPVKDPIKQTEKLRQIIGKILEKYGVDKEAKLLRAGEPAPTCKLFLPIMNKQHVGLPCVLRNYIAGHEPPIDLTVAEAILATCATPTIFVPLIVSKDFVPFEYVSADVGISNPIREVIAEAHRAFGDEATVSCLLSIGCGHPGVNSAPSDAGTTSRIHFLERVATDSEKVAHDMATQMGQLTLYHRFSVMRGLEASPAHPWREPGIISAHTTSYLKDLEVAEALDRCVDTMKHAEGFTTLEQLKHSGGAKIFPPPLPTLTVNYVERSAPMDFVNKALFEEAGTLKTGSKKVVVTGVGGCGKTQLIRKFIEEHGDRFLSTFFIDGSSKDNFQRDIIRSVRSLGTSHSQKSFTESMSFLSQTTSNGQRLLIIDNMDDPSIDLDPFIPRWVNGAVVVTSRNQSLGQLSPANHLRLDVMSMDESTELIVRAAGQAWPASLADKQAAMAIAEELGCLPIALIQAGSYMYNTGSSAETYIARLRGNRERVLRDPATSQVDMRYKTAFAAFDASYDILPLRAQKVVCLLSFFHWHGFPLELITIGAKEDFSTDQYKCLPRGAEFEQGKVLLAEIFPVGSSWDPMELDSTIATLRNHSLVSTLSAHDTRLLQMHPLVHEWARLRIPPGGGDSFRAAAIRLLCCGATSDNYSTMQFLSAHAQVISSKWEDLHANDALAIFFMLHQSGVYYAEAAQLAKQLHEKLKTQLGEDHLATIRMSVALVTIFLKLGRFAEAEVLGKDVLRRRRQLLGDDHPETWIAADNLVVVYLRLGRYAEAEPLQLKIVEKRKLRFGPEHLDTIRGSAHLARIYSCLGRYKEAEALGVEVLRQRKQQLGVEHPETIEASVNLALTYIDLGRYIIAEELLKEVARRRKQLLGVAHPDTLAAYANLALVYGKSGRLEDAEVLGTEILGQRKRVLGADHPDTIASSMSLACLYAAQGKYAEAEASMTKARRQRTHLLGADDPDNLMASGILAFVYGKMGRHAEAEKLAKEVLGRRKRLLGEDHPETLMACEYLATIYQGMKRYGEAVELEEEVLRQRKGVLGVNHPDTLTAADYVAGYYFMSRRLAEAGTLQKEVLEARIITQGERSYSTIRSMLFLAHIYGASRRRSEASAVAQRAKILALEAFGDGHELSQLISEFLVDQTSLHDRFAGFMKGLFSR